MSNPWESNDGGSKKSPTQDPNDTPAWATPEAAPVVVEQPSKKELKRTAAEDEKRQKEFQGREVKAVGTGVKGPDDPRIPKNFPPMPKCCQKGCIKPCYVIDYEGEIPDFGRPIVRRAFTVWSLYCFVIVCNWVGIMSGLADRNTSSEEDSDQKRSCFLASVYVVFAMILSFSWGYYCLYNAVRRNSSLQYAWFMLVCFCKFLLCVYASIGFTGSGFSGMWFATVVYSDNQTAGSIAYAVAAMWILFSILNFTLLSKVIQFYRSSGMSIEKAKGEAVRGAASNKAVQGVFIDAFASQA